ncbi:MAG: glycosyltransferase [Planctomycetaceae bacterium]
MAQPAPKVSIAMICRGDGHHLADALESALRQQTDFAVEILIGGDCSSDSIRQTLNDVTSGDPEQVRLVRSNHTAGARSCFETVLNECRGRYVAVLGCNGLWIDPRKLQKQVDLLEATPSCALCCHHLARIDESGNVLPADTTAAGTSILSFQEVLSKTSLAPGSAVVRRTDAHVFSECMVSGDENQQSAWLLMNATRGDVAFVHESMAASRDCLAAGGNAAARAEQYTLRNQTLRRLRRRAGRTHRKHIEWQLSANHAAISLDMVHRNCQPEAERHRRMSFFYGRWQAPLPLRTRISHAIRPCRFLHSIAARSFEFVTAAKQWPPFILFLFITILRQPTWILRLGRGLMDRGWAGLRGEYRTLEYLFGVSSQQYAKWVRSFDTLTDTDRTAINRRMETMQVRPIFSIIMPVYNTPELMLTRSIDSVLSQIYPYWELCIADDASSDSRIRRLLTEYSESDSRIHCRFRDERGNISAASNTALEIASGEFITLLDHDDELAEHALYMVAEEINQSPDADMIYSDEDRISENGERESPYFKSGWNPDLMLSQNMICHLVVLRRQLVLDVGSFRTGFEGSQDHDLVLRCSEQTTEEKIRHLPAVLYHWRRVPGSVSNDAVTSIAAFKAGARAVREHLERKKVQATVDIKTAPGSPHYRVRYALRDPPLVSVIVPTKDRIDLLRQSVDGLLHDTDYPRLDVIIVDNDSGEAATREYFTSLKHDARVRVVPYDGAFNYSAMNNFAVRQAAGDILCLLNNDTEVTHPDWLHEMVSHAARDEIGAVGAKLLYPDETIQHAGILVGAGGLARHTFAGLPKHAPVMCGRLDVVQNVSAVTAACMVLRKSVYNEMGGFEEHLFPIGYNDVDLCLRIVAAKYRIVWTPYAQLYHHESASRGRSSTAAQMDLDLRQASALRRRWSSRIAADPHLNPNVSIDSVDYRPAFPPRIRKPWQTYD